MPDTADASSIGGHAALDFVNTGTWVSGALASDDLGTYDDLARWGRQAAVLSAADSAALRPIYRADTARATAALDRARKIRRILHGVFAELATNHRATAIRERDLNAELAGAAGVLTLTWNVDRFAWTVDAGREPLDMLLARIVWSAAELLTSDRAASVGQCANPECGWVFVDATKNGNRRWCSMSECGSRDKARRYYHRQRRAANA